MGRSVEAWSGVGLLEQKEEDFPEIEEGIGEGSDVGIALELGSLSGMPRTLKHSLLLSLLTLELEEMQRRRKVAQVGKKLGILVSLRLGSL